MLRPSTPVIEYQGAEWSFRYDLRQIPTYIHLITRGRATERRNERLVETIRHNLPHTTDEAGRLYPLISDLREEDRASMLGLEGGQALQAEFGPLLSYVVLILAEYRSDSRLFESFASVLAQDSTEEQFAVVFTLEEAVEKVQAHHARRQQEA